ncbi:MAG TPA: signal peptidase I [Acidimicrobiaceae bacterium]|mgnify:CR=1 FL=1|nr:signal peptidase I [Acidimicrobiaceae bacterium]
MSDEPPARTEIDDLLAQVGVVVNEGDDSFGDDGSSGGDSLATDDGDVDSDHPPKKRSTRSPLASLVEWIVVVAVAIGAALLVKTYVLQQFQVAGSSMDTTLHDGDRVLVNKLSYRMHDPNRGDVVVLKTFEGTSERDLIKRVIALPGEVIDIRGNCAVYIDGRLLVEPYLDEVEAACSAQPTAQGVTTATGECPLSDGTDRTAVVSYPCVVPADSVFVLGDNRDGSSDSRTRGAIQYSDLLGRAFVVIWPQDDWQWL